MSVVGFRLTDPAPSEIGARPVTLLRIHRANELAVLHWCRTYRGSVRDNQESQNR